MSEITPLVEQYWICREQNRELYNKVKRDIPRFQKFVREQLGWKLLNHEQFLKLEKIPAHAESFMGIQEFQEIRDYVILCIVLMFLEDKEEQEQFLLSELIDYVGMQLRKWMEVDWNSFSQRKSLVRVLQYGENLGMLRVYEGNSQLLSQEVGQEVLYENTGLSRYFAVSFPYDLKECSSWEDFERERLEDQETDRGRYRIHRVYRRLTACPAMYWETVEDADSLYLKNQRQWIEKNMKEQFGGRLDIHKNAAFWVLEDEDSYGKLHPKDAQLPEVILLLGGMIRENVKAGRWKREMNETIRISREEFSVLVAACQKQWKNAWSKEYREMDGGRLAAVVKGYMKDWMMIEETEEEIIIFPAAVKQEGFYPEDYSSESTVIQQEAEKQRRRNHEQPL
jgi:uncharacterized protein (TIGR02678 family)